MCSIENRVVHFKTSEYEICNKSKSFEVLGIIRLLLVVRIKLCSQRFTERIKLWKMYKELLPI